MDYEQPEVYIFPKEQKYWKRWTCLKALFWTAMICVLIGILLGYDWRDRDAKLEIKGLDDRVEYYMNNCPQINPIPKEKEILKPKQEGRNPKIKLP